MTEEPPPDLMQTPRAVIVELTNACNLHCPLCTTHLAMSRPRGYMDPDLFGRIVAAVAEHAPAALVSMNMCGEPLLHPEVARFVALAADKGLSTFISTNATRLTTPLSEHLIEAGLSSIALCVDGATAESHEAYRVGSSFEQVRTNCEAFLAVRRSLHRSTPTVTIQTLLTSYSETEIEPIVKWAWESGADEVHFKSLSLGSSTTDEQRRIGRRLVPNDPHLQRTFTEATGPCKTPAEQTMIYWNGDLGFCCVDFNNAAGLQGIGEGGLFEALYSPETLAARERARNRGYALCSRCQSGAASFRGFRLALEPFRARGAEPEAAWAAVADEIRRLRRDSPCD